MELRSMKSLEVVVGGQYGSEAKGHVTQRLTERALTRECPVHVVRVAGPNAGHTGYDKDGQPWALRQVPIGVVVPDDRIVLGIAAGSEIDPPVLLDELDRLRDAGVLGKKTVWVHASATVITERDKIEEKKLIDKIGSTGKGIGAARARRLMRKADTVGTSDKLCADLSDRNVQVFDSHTRVANIISGVDSTHTIIEGTQGYGLGLHGPHYPKCTSSDCRAGDFMAMAGVHAWEFDDVKVWVVARMYPIRVAGDSGPMKRETTWEELGLDEEKTTVTKKVRRVGAPDWELVRQAVAANGGSPTVRVALTMVDQMFPPLKNLNWGTFPEGEDPEFDEDRTKFDLAYEDAMMYVLGIESRVGAKIGMITTGPNKATFVGT
jgi:adenylosuccinate synthase